MRLKPFRAGILAVGILLFGVLAATIGAGYAYDNAGETSHAVTNEPVTVDYTTPSEVDASDTATRFYDNETVRNSSGSELTEGEDYDWNTSAGTITWYDTSSTSSGEEATIDYAYDAKVEIAQDMKAMTSVMTDTLVFLPLIAAGFAFAAGVGAFLYRFRSFAGFGGNGGFGR